MRPQLADWQIGPRFGSPTTFMGVPATRDLSYADAAIVGLPFDGATSYRPGARFGPRAIREASSIMLKYEDALIRKWPPYDTLRVIDYGDIILNPNYVVKALEQTQEAIEKILSSGVIPISLGGDHSLTLGILRAQVQKYGVLSLLLLDAHPEFWDSDPDYPYTHGSWLRIAVEENIIDPKQCIMVGIRGHSSFSVLKRATSQGIAVITMENFDGGWVDIIKRSSLIINGPLYVSLDIDCVDPAYAPGTGTPEVGGFTSKEILSVIRVLKNFNIVGFDVMEVSPVYDHAEITSLLAANIVCEFLCNLTAGKK